MNDMILVERRGRIAILTLNDPEARNPLGNQMIDQLVGSLQGLNADPGISCVILTGAGSAFCAGGNIKDMQAGRDMFGGTPAEMRAKYVGQIQRIPRTFNELDVPVIAAVNGQAVGAGCDLALMADLRIASTQASFAESFLRVGLISGDGGAWFLPRVVGIARAYEMALTADPVSASQAETWGLVNHVVAPEKLLEEAVKLAERIVRHPPQALRSMKRLTRHGADGTLSETLELAALMQAAAQHSPDFKEAVDAMLEKREPQFTGG